VDNGVARIFQNFMERVMAMEDQAKLGSQMLGVYQQELDMFHRPPLHESSSLVAQILASVPSERLSAYQEAGCRHEYTDHTVVVKLDNALKGLHDHIQKEHAIIEDICRLLDEANRIMHEELTAQLENVVVTESEECSLAVKVQQLSAPDYVTTMAAISGMLQQDYMMQEKVVNTLGLNMSLEVLQNYVMMWTLRPFVDDSVVEKALSWTQH